MKWHIHTWKLSGALSWIIKTSTLFLGWHVFQMFLSTTQTHFQADSLILVLLSLIGIHYLFLLLVSLRSREILSSIGNLAVVLSTSAFISSLFSKWESFTIAMFALVMITSEAIHVLFYYLNEKDQPWIIRRTASLWLSGLSLLLFGLLVISVR